MTVTFPDAIDSTGKPLVRKLVTCPVETLLYIQIQGAASLFISKDEDELIRGDGQILTQAGDVYAYRWKGNLYARASAAVKANLQVMT